MVRISGTSDPVREGCRRTSRLRSLRDPQSSGTAGTPTWSGTIEIRSRMRSTSLGARGRLRPEPDVEGRNEHRARAELGLGGPVRGHSSSADVRRARRRSRSSRRRGSRTCGGLPRASIHTLDPAWARHQAKVHGTQVDEDRVRCGVPQCLLIGAPCLGYGDRRVARCRPDACRRVRRLDWRRRPAAGRPRDSRRACTSNAVPPTAATTATAAATDTATVRRRRSRVTRACIASIGGGPTFVRSPARSRSSVSLDSIIGFPAVLPGLGPGPGPSRLWTGGSSRCRRRCRARRPSAVRSGGRSTAGPPQCVGRWAVGRGHA